MQAVSFDTSSGVYTGSNYTTMNSSIVYGEGGQIQLPLSFVLTSYALTSGPSGCQKSMFYNWYIVGSLDDVVGNK